MCENKDMEFVNYGYGKRDVKILYVSKNDETGVHKIGEYEVSVNLKLYSLKDYTDGDNRAIVATDSQKNTIYLLAKKRGIRSPEHFASILCQHFLDTYEQIEQVIVEILKYPWNRIKNGGKSEHNHAFVYDTHEIRCARIKRNRNEPHATIEGGLRGLRVLKTTQSGFVDFVNDAYTTLLESKDRIFSTIVSCTWQYQADIVSVNYDNIYERVRTIILDKFAGDHKLGVYSPSVQNTIYLISKSILDQIAEVDQVKTSLPNIHYFNFDESKFETFSSNNRNGEDNAVFVPVDKPSGSMFAALKRNEEIARKSGNPS